MQHLLQDCKDNPNENSDSGRIALEVACKKGNLKIIQMLLEAGANINEGGHGGIIATHTAL